MEQRRPGRSWPGALQQELAPYGIKVQTMYHTGYNETRADNPFRWLDERKHVTKRADLRKGFDDFFATPEGRMDPQEMIDRMIEIVYTVVKAFAFFDSVELNALWARVTPSAPR